MGDDDNAGPSLFLAQHDTAQREHKHHHIVHNKRQTSTSVEQLVTQVVATVSVVQEIDVDSNGSTFSSNYILTNSTSSSSAAAATSFTVTDAAAATTLPASPGIVLPTAAASSTIVAPSLNTSIPQALQPTPSAGSSIPLIPTTFPSLVITSNSTTLISSLSSSSQAFSNSSITSIASTTKQSSTVSTLTVFALQSSSSSILASSSSTSSPSSSSLDSSTFSSYLPAATSAGPVIVGGGVGGTASSSAVPSSTAAVGTVANADGSTPSTSTVVGGVFGGIAGLAVIIFLAMFILRWRKRNRSMLLLSGSEGASATRGPPSQPRGMIQRMSIPFGIPETVAAFNAKINHRFSERTQRTVSSGVSETGFVRVSGRKLPSVFQSGGDGYTDPFSDNNTLNESSFYRDSTGFFGGPGSPTSPTFTTSNRESGVPVMRPSPARTPVTEHAPNFAVIPPPPRRPDLVGRSRPSQDGSHASRFQEEV